MFLIPENCGRWAAISRCSPNATERPVTAVAFRPLEQLLKQADERLAEVEGHALEDLAGQLYEERSRRSIGDFPLTERIRGYWDRADVEIDLVAVNDEERRIRFGTCKRNPDRLPAAVDSLFQSAARYLAVHRRFAEWRIDYVALSTDIDQETRAVLQARHVAPQSLRELTANL
jgi:hypothetical protein